MIDRGGSRTNLVLTDQLRRTPYRLFRWVRVKKDHAVYTFRRLGPLLQWIFRVWFFVNSHFYYCILVLLQWAALFSYCAQTSSLSVIVRDCRVDFFALTMLTSCFIRMVGSNINKMSLRFISLLRETDPSIFSSRKTLL